MPALKTLACYVHVWSMDTRMQQWPSPCDMAPQGCGRRSCQFSSDRCVQYYLQQHHSGFARATVCVVKVPRSSTAPTATMLKDVKASLVIHLCSECHPPRSKHAQPHAEPQTSERSARSVLNVVPQSPCHLRPTCEEVAIQGDWCVCHQPCVHNDLIVSI